MKGSGNTGTTGQCRYVRGTLAQRDSVDTSEIHWHSGTVSLHPRYTGTAGQCRYIRGTLAQRDSVATSEINWHSGTVSLHPG
jgi:hypothetical protein